MSYDIQSLRKKLASLSFYQAGLVIGHPLEYTFVYLTFTDDSEGGCPKTSRTREAEKGSQPNAEMKKRSVFNVVKLSNKC